MQVEGTESQKVKAQGAMSSQPASERAMIRVSSPADGLFIGECPSLSVEEALRALEETHEAQKRWAATPIRERAAFIRRFARVLHERADEVAGLITRENGKPLYEAFIHEVLPIVDLAEYFAARAPKILKPRPVRMHFLINRKSCIHYRPRGVTFIISPWNFPFTIPAGAVVMNLMAGNGVLLKPASLTPLIAYRMRELFDEAGLDPKLFQIVSGPGRMAEELIVRGAPMLGFVTFTGSTEIGRNVGAVCGRHFLPCSMELGGKDAAVVCADADIKKAARAIVTGAFANSGQVCASLERAYVHRDIYDELVNEVVRLTRNLRQGVPGYDPSVDIGAMTSEEQIRVIEAQIEDAAALGAQVLTGGRRSRLGPMFFEPTVIAGATEDMLVMREESFGPVLPIMKVEDEEEAVRHANDSIYGLSAYVFTRNRKKAGAIAGRLEAGTVMVNDVIITHAMPETPWQGVKQSGVGRAHSDEGLRDLCHAGHVNYDVISIPSMFWDRFWVWHPYHGRKVNLYHALYGLLFVRYGLKRRLALLGKLVLNSLLPSKRPERA